MSRPRLVLAGTLAVIVLALALPALSLAGGSAGNQQYTDPFSGGAGTTSTGTTQSAPPTTTATSAPATTTTAPATTDPATTASDPTTPARTLPSSAGTLPYTGYSLWTGAGFGITLIVGGVALRRRARRA